MQGLRFIEHVFDDSVARDEAPAAVTEAEALDAYSAIVTSVADRLAPSVTSLRVARRLRGGRRAEGAGSGVVITPDGFALTSAHVIQGTDAGSASFADGREFPFQLVGSDPLSALAVIGLGLAVPINRTTGRILAALMREGRFRRSYLGIAGGRRPLPPRLAQTLRRRAGVEVAEVVGGSPAAGAGLRRGDVIVELASQPVEGVGDLQRLMAAELIGRPVTVRVLRGGETVNLSVTPSELAS